MRLATGIALILGLATGIYVERAYLSTYPGAITSYQVNRDTRTAMEVKADVARGVN